MNKIYSFLVFLLFMVTVSYSQMLDIGLFYNSKITALTFHNIKGSYQILNKNKVVKTLNESNIIYITLIGKYLQVRNEDELIGTFRSLKITGTEKENEFAISTILDKNKSRQYDDDLYLNAKPDFINIINHVDFEKYIAGVVETEAGSTSELEYYKSQALICRTYAYKNMYRHGEEGFNLCDGVHCQAYKGSSFYNKLIPKATFATRSLIIVDTTLEPIDAAFYSNSGGYTANSEEVWISKKPYLRSVEDTFSLKGSNATWMETISFTDWKKYLKSKGFMDLDNRDIYKFHSRNPKRRKYYYVGIDSLLYTEIRKDLNLKSAFFEVKSDVNNDIKLIGKGYGHGVGLSQEGGMEMAKQGKTFEDIIHFYYSDVKILSYRELKKEKKQRKK